MKIKLAILEQDRSYLTRIVSAFGRQGLSNGMGKRLRKV